ncbi:MAG: hypothetical protein GJ676_11855 [Rhodobacteraceae bacterium]|nr:hypothetical protein [Paracoccaceae bacterium]
MTHAKTETAAPAITPRTRARARHILDHYYIGPARDDAVLEIWGYTPGMTYAPGEQVDLHVSTTGSHWDLEVGRDGAGYDPVLTQTNLPGTHHPTPRDCSVQGCGWPVTHSFTIPEDWRPGGYMITLRAHRDGDMVEEHHLILIRDASRPAPYLLVCATGTWVAYNCWGGSNHYEGITGPDHNAFSPILSTQRPWTRGFCKLPQGAPRAVPEHPAKPGDMVRYPYMEWAYAYGYSKKYASAGWASYERPFARWAEHEGYALDLTTQHDLQTDPDMLSAYKCVIFVGHDEYWSREMRDAVDSYTENGGRVARFAGNFLWQIRLEDQARRQVCYKYTMDQDPLWGNEDLSRVTGAWDMAPVNHPGALTFGVNGTQGIYAGFGNLAGRGPSGFTVYRSDHWAFKDTHLGYGDLLGHDARIFGYEVDGLDYTFRDGLPFPAGTDGAAPEVQVLALGLATNIEADHSVWGETLYIGSDDAKFKAYATFGEVTEATLDASARGNGMIVSWQRGRGEVFTAGTCEWVMGLVRGDAQVCQVTRNVLNRFGTG